MYEKGATWARHLGAPPSDRFPDVTLARPYVVMLGLPMYVDRGNHPSPAPAAWVDLAGDPKLPNRGGGTFEEALAYAKTLAAM